MNVELIYDLDCPNYRSARTQILKAFAKMKIAPRWKEWDRNAPDSPSHVRLYGSPTILVNGQDVCQAEPSMGNSCRLYPEEKSGFRGMPSVNTIFAALRASNRTIDPSPKPWKRMLTLLPVIGTAFLPKLVCPACWPAYAGILSALGLGFVNYSPYLFPLSIVFVGIVLFSLTYRAKTRNGYGPLLAGSVASVVLLVGKFGFESDLFLYGGVAGLVGSSIWNTWPRRDQKEKCPACINTNQKGGETHETQKNH